MSEAEQKSLVKTNTIYWVTAMAIPIIFDLGMKAFASEGARFPWTIVIPLLFVGLLIASNKLITTASASTKNPEGGS